MKSQNASVNVKITRTLIVQTVGCFRLQLKTLNMRITSKSKPETNCNFSRIQGLNLKCFRRVFSQRYWNFLRFQKGTKRKKGRASPPERSPSAAPSSGNWEQPSVSLPLQSLSGGQKRLSVFISIYLKEFPSLFSWPFFNSLRHREGRPHLEETFKSEAVHQVTGVWVILSTLKASWGQCTWLPMSLPFSRLLFLTSNSIYKPTQPQQTCKVYM